MISLSDDIKILVAMDAIDMRCGIDSLSCKVSSTLNAKPQDCTLFIFFNKARDRMKGLLWDRNGFILLHKRIETERFSLPKSFHDSTLTINHTQFQALLAGFDFVRMQDYPEIKFEDLY